jgi:hypothetical protein
MAHLVEQIRLLVETACREEGKPPIVALVEVMDYIIGRFILDAAVCAAAGGKDPADDHVRKSAETDFFFVAKDRFKSLWSTLPTTDTFQELKAKAVQKAKRRFEDEIAHDLATLTQAMRDPRYAGQCIAIGLDGTVRELDARFQVTEPETDLPKKH